MRQLFTPKAVAVVALASAAVVAACSSSSNDNSCGSGTPPDLDGDWALRSYTVGTTTIPAPPASGELRIHSSNNTYYFTATLPGPTTVVDSGTYTQTGQTCLSQSSVLGNPQFVGTYTTNGSPIDSLVVQGSAGGQTLANGWRLIP